MREIQWISQNGITNDVAVVDPIFNLGAGKQYLHVLDAFLQHRFRGRLSLQCRADLVTPDFLDRLEGLRSAGVEVVPEFGLQTIHRAEQKAVRRVESVTKVAATLNAMRQRGLPYELTVIYGLPQQTVESFKQTMGFCMHHAQAPMGGGGGGDLGKVRAFPLMMLKGTGLEAEAGLWALQVSEQSLFDVNGAKGVTFMS